MCRQTSILPEKGVAALQNNFFITNLMDVLQRTPGSCSQEAAALNSVTNVAAGQLLSCPNHGGNVWVTDFMLKHFLCCLGPIFTFFPPLFCKGYGVLLSPL